MKKLDKLVLKTFFGPFIVTMSVVVFVFLMRIMIFYINDFVSKDLGLWEFAKLFYYFALGTVPIALPLAILLSSLMAFGNLGEFFELTAMKSAGVSVIRIMLPLFIVAVFISVFSFFFNDRVVPWSNLKGYTLLYDIKTTKATFNIREGIFYNDLPGYSIKVDKKMPDKVTMKGMVIYKHDYRSYERGNTEIILADSGRIYTINNNGYLVLELFHGVHYQEMLDGLGDRSVSYAAKDPQGNITASKFMRDRFDNYKQVVGMESFGMNKTDEGQFKYHAFMKGIVSLNNTTDSLRRLYTQTKKELPRSSQQYYSYQFKVTKDYIGQLKYGKWVDSLVTRPMSDSIRKEVLKSALNSANSMKNFATTSFQNLESNRKEGNKYELEKHHKYAQAISCLVLFLIGAPLGAIIKKGGFGLPVLIAIVFFILMYVLTRQGDKWVEEGLLAVPIGAWISNTVLLLCGIYFTDRARNDSRLFDKDVYIIFFGKVKRRFLNMWNRYFDKNAA